MNLPEDKQNYRIDSDGHLRLRGVDQQITCPTCNKMLAIQYSNTKLIKSRTIIIDGDRVVIRCRNCKTYITVDGEKKLLTV